MPTGIAHAPSTVTSRTTRAARCAPPFAATADRRIVWIVRLSWANLAAVGLVMLLLCFLSERWWLSALLTYLPRAPYAFPALLLLVASLVWRRGSAWVNGLSLLLVLGPIMGFTTPVASSPAPSPGRTTLRIVSANAQEGRGSLLRLLHEIEQFQPDIVALQETSRGCESLAEHFADWHVVHLRAYFVASKYPVRVVDHCKAEAFQRWSALLVEIDGPDGPFLLGDTHLMTPRHGATGMTVLSPITGTGVEEFEWHQWQRQLEAETTRDFIDRHHTRPLLMMGDFNAPTTSSLFATHWGDLQSAYESAGTGFGYTAPCNTDSVWPQNTPWVRIDHVLADDRWSIHDCRIGTLDGSDHRLIFAEVSLK
jgi:endonuclease/exonuclease/phosphatase family metal-dependent hydrolase